MLIPDYLYTEFENLRDYHGGLKILTGFLLRRYFNSNCRFSMLNRIATTVQYQEDGINLHREDFRPVEWDWIELKLLANSHNMSVCSFFVLLLQLELAGAFEIICGYGVVPPYPRKIILHQSMTCYSIPQFMKVLHMRI